MQSILVTDGNFTYVAIDDQGHPQAIPQGSGTMISSVAGASPDTPRPSSPVFADDDGCA